MTGILTWEEIDARRAEVAGRAASLPDMSKRVGAAYYTAAAEFAADARRLVAEARALAKDMTRLADNVERHGIEASVNGLGEIQSRGSQVDAFSGAFIAARDALRTIERIVEVSSL